MAKLQTQTFDLLEPGQYVLKINKVDDPQESNYQGEVTLQVCAELEVVEGPDPESVGHTYYEYWSLDAATGAVKQSSKLWDVFEGATRQKLTDDDELDTDDLVGKQFQAQVVVNKPGTRNRTEHGTIGPVKKKRGKTANAGQTNAQAAAEEANEADFDEIDL